MAKSVSLQQLEWFGNALSASAGFRSKSLKVIQYASRLLVWWADSQKREGEDQSASTISLDAVQGARSLGKAVGSARKIMNLGDCISDYFAMQAAIETAWADPGNATRFRNAVAAVSDFACDATTDWLLLASLTKTDESVPRWVTRTNDISWAVSAAFGVVRAAHKVLRQTTVVELRLARNALEELPDAISALVNLKVLDVAGNRLTGFPKTLGTLTKLEELDASENEITEITSEIGNLKRLKRLIMFKNKLSSLPSDLCTCEALEEINFYNNKLIKVPASLERLVRVDNVNFGGNRLKTFLKPSGWTQCTRLALMQNTIVILPSFEGMTNLRQLQLNQTVIGELPGLGRMPKLEMLDASKCRISSLPEDISLLVGLRTLSAPNNNISSIPDTIGACASLQTLNLAGNSLSVIPPALGDCLELKVLLLRKNSIRTLPVSMLKLKKIERVDVSSNPLSADDAGTAETIGALRAICTDKRGFLKVPDHM